MDGNGSFPHFWCDGSTQNKLRHEPKTYVESTFMLMGVPGNMYGHKGGWLCPHFFHTLSPWKRGLEVPNFLTFPNLILTIPFRKKCVFTVIDMLHL